jgi:hypothetical protein
MGKNTNFTGQSILNQLLFYIRGVNIKRIAKKYDAERYVHSNFFYTFGTE